MPARIANRQFLMACLPADGAKPAIGNYYLPPYRCSQNQQFGNYCFTDAARTSNHKSQIANSFQSAPKSIKASFLQPYSPTFTNFAR
jgi:hypothetical protein